MTRINPLAKLLVLRTSIDLPYEASMFGLPNRFLPIIRDSQQGPCFLGNFVLHQSQSFVLPTTRKPSLQNLLAHGADYMCQPTTSTYQGRTRHPKVHGIEAGHRVYYEGVMAGWSSQSKGTRWCHNFYPALWPMAAEPRTWILRLTARTHTLVLGNQTIDRLLTDSSRTSFRH